MVPPADVNKCKQNSFFLSDWKPPSHSQTRAGPCSSAGSGSFQGWASSTGAWCLQPSGAQIWGLSALASQLIPASGFKPKAKGSSLRKVLGHSIFAEFAFFMISLRNQMKPASEVVCDPLKAVWQNHSFSGTGFRISVQEDLGSFCSTLLITSGWHQGSYLKRSLFKSNL